MLQGAPAGFENTLLRGAWSKDDGGRRVAVGGADRMVCIWEVDSGKILYKVCLIFGYPLCRGLLFALASWPQGYCNCRGLPPSRTYQ